jgi:hypothetical protein
MTRMTCDVRTLAFETKLLRWRKNTRSYAM